VALSKPADRAKPAATVAVLGQGYVGLPLALRAVEVGYEVVGYDTDPGRVKRLEGADSYVEDVPSSELRKALASGRYKPTLAADDLVGFDVALITVPTPLKEGVPDMSFIEDAGRDLAAYLRPGALVVLESTTYPGTTEELLAGILESGSGLRPGQDFHLGYSPERIDPGNREFGITSTPKVVSGVNEASLQAVESFYRSLVERTVRVSRPREAELAKLIENTFRHVNIALVNELAMFAAELGVDIWEALDAAATKPFGFMRFNPGPGVGGHCLPIDPSYLSWHIRSSLSRSFRFVELANDVNDHMPEYVVQRLMLALNGAGKSVRGSRVLLLGVTYKANTSDMRESPGLVIARRLLRLGAEVRYADSHVSEVDVHSREPRLVRARVDAGELSAADAVVVLADHDDVDYGFVSARARYVFDTRRRCQGPAVEHL
jgi:UDP-N-acetyl-D-glucosamine dehydrogenase